MSSNPDPVADPSRPRGGVARDSATPRGNRSRGWLSWLGPGVLTGASDDDPSGIGTYAQAGAAFGAGMLWVMLFTFPLMAVVQIICARVARVTGRGLAANLAKVVPRWMLVVLTLALFATNAINIGADLSAMGYAAALLAPGEPAWYAFGLGVLSIGLQVWLPYSRYVRVLKWLTVSLLAYVATAFTLQVPWTRILLHTLVPHLEFTTEFGAMLVAVLGTTISPYLFFWQSAQEAEEQHAAPDEEPLKTAPEQAGRQLKRVRTDTILGMGISNAIGFFIMLTSALTLNAHGVRDIQTASQAAEALRPFAGHWAFVLFAAGIVGTGLLAVPVLAGSAGYALAETLAWRRGLEKPARAAPAFYGVIVIATVAGIALPALHVNPIHALVLSAVLNGIIAVPILVVLMLAGSNENVMGEFCIPKPLRILGWLTAVVMAVAALGLLL
ncbi:MAG TPA: divalent metal cation transporter [Ramlibacter sp.]|nr:divalent metal cation transporter [Ramlibacter sp.]